MIILKWLFVPVLVIGAFFFLQSEETRLKKKTLKLILIFSHSTPSATPLALLRKTQKVVKHVHFSVEYQVQAGSKTYQNRSLNRLRSDLNSYFKHGKSKNSHIEIPSKKDITVSLSPNQKTAKVNWTQLISYKEQKLSCQVVVNWEKEKSWLIHQIQASCQKK